MPVSLHHVFALLGTLRLYLRHSDLTPYDQHMRSSLEYKTDITITQGTYMCFEAASSAAKLDDVSRADGVRLYPVAAL